MAITIKRVLQASGDKDKVFNKSVITMQSFGKKKSNTTAPNTTQIKINSRWIKDLK